MMKGFVVEWPPKHFINIENHRAKTVAGMAALAISIGASGCGVLGTNTITVPEDAQQLGHDGNRYYFAFTKEDRADAHKVDCNTGTERIEMRQDGSVLIICDASGLYGQKVVVR